MRAKVSCELFFLTKSLTLWNQPRPRCFPKHNQVGFFPKPNQEPSRIWQTSISCVAGMLQRFWEQWYMWFAIKWPIQSFRGCLDVEHPTKGYASHNLRQQIRHEKTKHIHHCSCVQRIHLPHLHSCWTEKWKKKWITASRHNKVATYCFIHDASLVCVLFMCLTRPSLSQTTLANIVPLHPLFLLLFCACKISI